MTKKRGRLDAIDPSGWLVRLKQPDGTEHEMSLFSVRREDVLAAVPWRAFRPHRGQPHYSGVYWSSTTRDHVPYESRHEMGRVILADFDRAVVDIKAQPFLLMGRDEHGRRRRHVPDFFLALADQTSTLVNVKTAARLTDPSWSDDIASDHLPSHATRGMNMLATRSAHQQHGERLTPTLSPAVTLRRHDGTEFRLALSQVRGEDVLGAAPWRTLRQYPGQRHISGLYWSAKMRGLVPYESRKELFREILADFDRNVVGMAAQPFLLTGPAPDRRRDRRHVPDLFLALADGTYTVVNVKPQHILADPRVAATLDWANAEFAANGWRTEVWTGENPVVVSNVRFLSACRRSWLFDKRELEIAQREVRPGDLVGEAESRLRALGIARPRPLLLHLLWIGALEADLTQSLDVTTRLERTAWTA